MFCPKCKAEYRKEFYVCSDCHISLVDKLPEDPTHEFIEYVEVLRTYNPADVALIKSILDAEDITYCFNAEHFMYIYPVVEPARLMVKKDEAEEAREILKDLRLSIIGINTRDDNNK